MNLVVFYAVVYNDVTALLVLKWSSVIILKDPLRFLNTDSYIFPPKTALLWHHSFLTDPNEICTA